MGNGARGNGALGPGVSELLSRLRRAPVAGLHLVTVSLLIHLLGLATSLYVTQMLNRYIGYGVTGTLVTLTAGVLAAVLAEWTLRRLRFVLAERISGDDDARLAASVFSRLLTVPLAVAQSRPLGEHDELIRAVERGGAMFGPGNLVMVVDLPFSLLFLAVLALLSPALALVTGCCCAVLVTYSAADQRRRNRVAHQLPVPFRTLSGLLATAGERAETVRQFAAGRPLMAAWNRAALSARQLQRALAWQQFAGDAATRLIQSLLTIAVIAVGATQVLAGTLDVGALIGANLIAVRALAPLVRLVHLNEALNQAAIGLATTRRFTTLPVERQASRTLPDWRGELELRRLGLTLPGAHAPLFSGVSVAVPAGSVLVVSGRNGAGKTSLLRLLAGLLEPDEGDILIDGVDLRQLALPWWRSRVSYLPQEPLFLDASLRDNLKAVRPDAEDGALWRCLSRVGLDDLTNQDPAGLDMMVSDGGRRLAPGQRRRLALARALLVDGPLCLFDEPTEGLDREGVRTVYDVLIALAREGKTMVIVSHDPVILRGARQRLDLDGGRATLTAGRTVPS